MDWTSPSQSRLEPKMRTIQVPRESHVSVALSLSSVPSSDLIKHKTQQILILSILSEMCREMHSLYKCSDIQSEKAWPIK